MLNSRFSQVRNSMHTFSRAPLAKGQKWLDQATSPAGHNVSYEKVRAEEIPTIATLADRDANFLVVKNGKRIVGGSRGGEFADRIRFLDKFSLKEIPNTNGESYVIVDENENHQTNFIDPSDKPIGQYALSEGYELVMLAEDGVTKISRNIGWDFDSFNGIIHFSGKNPSSEDWEFGQPTVEGFIYTGKMMSDKLNAYNEKFDTLSSKINDITAAAIAIQPFKFSTQEMTTVGEPYVIEGSDEHFQRLSIVIPGYVFDLISLDKDDTVMTEMRHLANGDTQVLLDFPWSVEYECPIMSYTYEGGIDGVGPKTPVVGKYKFTAIAFVMSDGSRIQMKPTMDYEEHPDEVIPSPAGHHPSVPFEDGVPVPPHHGPLPPPPPPPPFPPPFPGYVPYSDDDTIINVYGTPQN